MTKKTEDNSKSNVKPLRKDIKIEQEGLESVPNLVNELKELLQLAESGELQSIVYAGNTEDGSTMMKIVGNVTDPYTLQVSLDFLIDEFKHNVTLPTLFGYDPAEFE